MHSRSRSRSKKSSSIVQKDSHVKKVSRRKSKTTSKKSSRKSSSKSKQVSQAGGKGVKMTAGLGELYFNLQGVPSILFAGWNNCGYCRDFVPIWEEFASNPVVANSGVVLSNITAYNSSPIIPGIEVDSFPSIYYTLSSGNSMLYSGERTVDAMISFMHELGMAKMKDDIAEAIADDYVNRL
jgi:Thioredoxin